MLYDTGILMAYGIKQLRQTSLPHYRSVRTAQPNKAADTSFHGHRKIDL